MVGLKNKESITITIRLPRWLVDDVRDTCQPHRQYQNGDGTLNENKFIEEAVILKIAELKGEKIVLHKDTSLILEGVKRGLKSD